MNITKVAMTFDDGYGDLYTNAFSIMKKYGLIGTAFVNTISVGDSSRVTYSQLLEMQSVGWEVGSHAHNHVDITTLNEVDARYELSQSKMLLEQYGLNVTSFAPPSRQWNNTLAIYAGDEGYQAVRALNIVDPYIEPYPIADKLFVMHGSPSIDSLNEVPSAVKNWIDTAISERGLLTLLFHRIQSVDDNYSTHLDDFETICAYLKSKVNNNEIIVDTFFNSLTPTLFSNSQVNRILESDRILPADRNLVI